MKHANADSVSVDGLVGLRDYVVDREGSRGLVDTAEGPRAEAFVVARESDEFNMQLLDGMVRQTLAAYPQIPGRDALVELGVEPVLDPGSYNAWVVEDGGTRAVLFERHGTWCLYSKGSAAKADSGDDDNGFCRILRRLFEELRPVNVYLATFSRLIRNTDFAGPVMASARQHVGTIYCREMIIEPANPAHRLAVSFLAGFSDMERTSQMIRLVLGLLAKHDRGEWWRGRQAVPLGYRVDAKKVVPDPRARHVVALMLELLARGATVAETVAELGALGVASPDQTGTGWAYRPPGGGEWGRADRDLRAALAATKGKTVADLAYPMGVYAKFIAWLPGYENGQLPTPHQSPVDGVDRFGKHPVSSRLVKGKRKYYVEMTYPLGLPDGGWATADVFAAAAVRAEEHAARSRGPLASPLLLPLLARPARWTRDGRLYQVSWGRGQTNGYSLISIDAAEAQRMGASRPGRAFDGWDRGGEFNGRVEAWVHGHALHASIAEAAAAAFEQGVEARALPPAGQWPEPADGLGALPSADLDLRVANLAAAAKAEARKAFAAGSRYALYVGPDDGHAELLRQLSEAASASSAAAHRRVEQARRAGVDAGMPEPPNKVEAPAELLRETLVALGRTPGAVPREVAAATGRIVRDLRMDADPVWVRWTAALHVPMADGILVLGPIGGRVRNSYLGKDLPPGTPSAKKGAVVRHERDRALLDAVLTEDNPAVILARDAAGHGRPVRLRLARRLADEHGMHLRNAHLLMGCPIPATRRAVWAMVNGHEPRGVSARFAELLRVTYLGPEPIAQNVWWPPVIDRSAAIEVVVANGGGVLACRAKSLFRDAGLPDHGVYEMTTGSGSRPVLVRVPSRDGRVPGCCRKSNCRSDRLELRRCPSCGGWATLVARVPECPVGVLCPRCLRMPVTDSPQFPGDYGLLDNTWVHDKQDAFAPDQPLFREKYRAREARRSQNVPRPPPGGRRPRGETAAARSWAASNGIRIKRNAPVPDWAYRKWEEAARLANSPASTGPVAGQRTPAAVRAWARATGVDVPPSGRLAGHVWLAYDQACAARGPE